MKQPTLKRMSVTPAFSLIEVVLALAVVTVAMVTILGLFPQGLNSARNAIDDSLIAIIVQDTITSRRIDIQTGVSTIGASGIPSRWFTPDGKETNAANASVAMFKCDVITSLVGGISNLENTRVRVVWPWFAVDTSTKSPPNTNIFVTEITRY